MLDSQLEQRLNDHLNLELASAHLYLSMSAYLENKNLSGYAHWMYIQYQEEVSHAMKFFSYINDRGGQVVLNEVPRPTQNWDSPLQLAKATVEHEQLISQAINKLVGKALELQDFATHNFLQWFVSEQVEEEASAMSIVDKLELLGGSKQGLYLLDRELSDRPADID